MSAPFALSVVIPVFNGASTVADALDSVRCQTLQPDEVIIVDDGSIDGTYDAVHKFLQRHDVPRWTLLRQTNKGAAGARDIGIRKARGSHIALLDADDTWQPEKLEVSSRLLKACSFDLLGAGLRPATSAEVQLVDKHSMLFYNPFFTSTTVFSRAAYFEVGGFDCAQRYSEDYKLWLTFAWSGKRCGLMAKSYATYRPTAEGSRGGLSSHLWRMQRCELGNFSWLRKSGKTSLSWCLAAQAVSWIKFARRIAAKSMR